MPFPAAEVVTLGALSPGTQAVTVGSRWGMRDVCTLLSKYFLQSAGVTSDFTSEVNQDKVVLELSGFFSLFSLGDSTL